MRAIRVHAMGGPEVMRLEKAPNPVPKRGQLVVRVHAAGVNPVDTYRRAGVYNRLPQLPWTPGSDAAGVVERVRALGAEATEDDLASFFGDMKAMFRTEG